MTGIDRRLCLADAVRITLASGLALLGISAPRFDVDFFASLKTPLTAEMGPLTRAMARRYFEPVRFSTEGKEELKKLHDTGFVVHVMRSTAWINYLYLAWAMVTHGLPAVRAAFNLRQWFSRPWRKMAVCRAFEERWKFAVDNQGSALIFLKRSAFGSARGRSVREDPFPSLVALARQSTRPVFLVPELFVWEKSNHRLKPSWVDYFFGSTDAPGFLHTVAAFFRNYRRAQFRIGQPINLTEWLAQHPKQSDAVVARTARSALYHHLAKETRAVFGATQKSTRRLIVEILRDRDLKRSIQEQEDLAHLPPGSLHQEAVRMLQSIAAKADPTVLSFLDPLLRWVFNRIYDGIEVDEAGLDRAMKAAGHAPLVLCPSHKSHIDYLVLSWILWNRGYAAPLVAAGANLSFFPLGPIFRRAGAFFLRRTFKDDPLYTACFKAYLKKLVKEKAHQEFFPEGGRSRTGKLLTPRLGMLTWEVEAALDGLGEDLHFVPVAIDYEKVVESRAYSKELLGDEKKKESIRSLLSAPKVLTSRYGRIHVGLGEPISLRAFIEARGKDDSRRRTVQALGHRIIYGISRVSTVTPYALAATALLSQVRKGSTPRQMSDRIGLLRDITSQEGHRLSSSLTNAPSDPTVMGPIKDAIDSCIQQGLCKVDFVNGQPIYQAVLERRLELSFYKNTLMNVMASRSLVASSILACRDSSSLEEVRASALFLSRLFKLEFFYRMDARFDSLFNQTLEQLTRLGTVVLTPGGIIVAPETHAAPTLSFLATLVRDLLESYYAAALTLPEVKIGAWTRKEWVQQALETARSERLIGKITSPEAVSRTSLENAMALFIDQGWVAEMKGKLRWQGTGHVQNPDTLIQRIQAFVSDSTS